MSIPDPSQIFAAFVEYFLEQTAIEALPQSDPDLPLRQKALAKNQVTYNFDKYAHFAGFYGPGFLGLPPSFLKTPPTNAIPQETAINAPENIDFYSASLINNTLAAVSYQFTGEITKLEDYQTLTTNFFKQTPAVLNNLQGEQIRNWLNDDEFARQRLQGMNAEMITQITPDTWTNNYSKKVLPELSEKFASKWNQSLKDAIANGLVYILDFSILDNQFLLTMTQVAYNRFAAAPIALFYNVVDPDPSKNKLVPISIQLFPYGSKNAPGPNFLFTPDGSLDWLLAKIWVNSVDGIYMEVVPHLFECHLVTEAITISTHRQLSERHPLFRFLKPHFYYTLQINDTARGSLLAVNGPIAQIISVGVPGGGYLIHEYLKTWDFSNAGFHASLKRRGFGNDETSPNRVQGYYWRDDGKKVWTAINNFVSNTMKLFYKNDDEIKSDFELQAWAAEISSPVGGAINGFPSSFSSVSQLVEALTEIIFVASAKHASGNIGQFDYYGFIPNVPGALYIPPVIIPTQTTWETILKALPPKSPTVAQIGTTKLLSKVGEPFPPLGHATYNIMNPFFTEAQKNFQTELKVIIDQIDERNSTLRIPYNLVNPSIVGNSIYI